MAASTSDEFVYDAANETLVIGAALADAVERKRLVHVLSADEFLVPQHASIWRALRRAADSGLDPTSEVMERLIRDAGGDATVVDHAEAIRREVPKNLEWHVETMSWDATRARVISGAATTLLKNLRDPAADRADVVTAARAVTRALEGSGRRHMKRPAEVYRSYRAEIAARRVKRNVYPLGAEPFDANLTEGFMPGRTTVSSGLSSSGKSTLWIAFALMLARIGRRPLYCAWEMPVDSLLDVATAHMTRIELKRIVQGTITDEETERVDKASRWILSKIQFMGNPFFDLAKRGGKPSNDRNLDVLEGHIAESGCDVVVYDLWERMLPWRRPEDVESALHRMQAMHEEYGLHGVILQQLRLKDVEARADKRPTRESIKGTSGYVEVPDLIFGVHRDGQFKDVEDNTIETICLKQRKGRLNWAVAWNWDGATCGVSEPREVRYDPGFEHALDGADVGTRIQDPGQIRSKKRRSKIGRRDQ